MIAVMFSMTVRNLLAIDVVIDHLVQADVDSLGYDVHRVNPEVVVADLPVDVLVDLLALDVLFLDCEEDVLDATLDVANLLDDSIFFSAVDAVVSMRSILT